MKILFLFLVTLENSSVIGVNETNVMCSVCIIPHLTTLALEFQIESNGLQFLGKRPLFFLVLLNNEQILSFFVWGHAIYLRNRKKRTDLADKTSQWHYIGVL